MLSEIEIRQRIVWLEDSQDKNLIDLVEHIDKRQMWRVSDDMDKIAETRGKIFALKLVLGEV